MLWNRKAHKDKAGRVALILARHGVDLLFDVGANRGQTGQSLRQWNFDGQIVSFEPVPSAYEALRQAASGDPLWTVAPRMALGESEGEISITESEASDMSSAMAPTPELLQALPKTRAVGQVVAPIRRFDRLFPDYLGTAQRPFLKVDAQGYDLAVLQGAEGVLDRISGVKIEMSLFPLYAGEPRYTDIIDFLEQRGFEPHLMEGQGYSRPRARQLQVDAVFMRR